MSVRLPAARRRRQLLDVALDVFAARGYHQASMDEVAEAAGVTKPVLYQHFSSKRELYLKVLDNIADELMDTVVDTTAVASGPRAQVKAGFAAYFHYVADHANAFRVLFGAGRQPDKEIAAVTARFEEAMAAAVAALITAGIDSEHRRVLAHGIVGIAESTSRYWVSHNLDIAPDVLAARIADLAWAGLRGIKPR